MMGTEIADVFLKRRIQSIISRAHHMWLYSGSMDETRVNLAELSEKELLDEVRHLTHFSQEDSISLLALQEPYDFDHQPNQMNPFSWSYLYMHPTSFSLPLLNPHLN
jgi:hypothetical protein